MPCGRPPSPRAQGSDLAGVVDEVGPGVTGFAVGDEVLGFVDTRSSQAELVVVEVEHLVAGRRRCPGRWPVRCSWPGRRRTPVSGPSSRPGDTVVVSGAAGGVGTVTVQLAVQAGATVIGLASEDHHQWLADHGVIPVTYGDGVVDRIRKASDGHIDAFIDTFGGGYVEMAVELGVAPDRINTIIDREAAANTGPRTTGTGRRPRPRSWPSWPD